MRLGGPVFGDSSDPERWIAGLRSNGYRAAYCPISPDASDDVVRSYADAAARSDIVIAETGAWSNPISSDDATRAKAIAHCQSQLALADRIGARCCVNITGSRGPKWDGPDPRDLTDDTFDLIVETTRQIIDGVNPTRSFYALETMPWMYPDSPDSYLKLIQSIDRKGLAVHFDPVNLINCPSRYFNNGEFIRECFAKLGPWIKSCHAKDILLGQNLTVHLDEVRPGLGQLDYAVFLGELTKFDPDTPVMLEHLPSEEEYKLAASHVRGVARSALGIEL